jgi:phosphoenolpyruvate carboxylase
MSEKKVKVNYSAEDADKLAALYAEHGNAGMKVIAEVMNRTVKSVRSKLVAMKVYVPDAKAPAKDAKDEGPTKKELLADLYALGFDVDGLDGATKVAISRLIDLVKQAA